MTTDDVVLNLTLWTPFLAEGFLTNIEISLMAMGIGTVVGTMLAFMRLSTRKPVFHIGVLLTEGSRNIPTFVFLFYLAFLIPVEISYGGRLVPVPAWFKAALALSIAVVGFVSDNFKVALEHWRRHDSAAALLFIPSWTSYLLIIIMASSTASVIGVSEIVSRCNTVIAATGNNDMMLWTYFYAMTWFFMVCFPLNLLMRELKTAMHSRMQAKRQQCSAISQT